ncbi:unnamed protein product [Soboliphyme baturini]|uniref:Uncharacterized protein n=1 Tax=Soboliphyme baturini TaxID=241478 RepID=A0A183JAZ0_9BILA|nr:unnamed protein product [Soboliphyme baturini]
MCEQEHIGHSRDTLESMEHLELMCANMVGPPAVKRRRKPDGK